MILKILSWNIWIDGNFDQISHFLKKSNADIIALQEVLPSENKINVIDFLKSLRYEHFYSDSMQIKKNGNMVYMGNATFSKYKIVKNVTHLLSKDKGRIALQTDININDKLIHVFNIHLTHAHLEESEIRDLQMEKLLTLLPSDRTLVMGDFNSLPQSRTIKLISKVLKNTDSIYAPTWSNYPKGCEVCLPDGIKYKLDYIFTSKDIVVKSFEVGNSKASDHLPISAVLEV